MNKIKNIFEFDDAASYVSYIWEQKKSSNPLYSIRSWSKSLGFASSSTMSLILKQQRKITKNQAVKIIKALEFSAYEADYFEALVDHGLQVSEEGKSFYINKLQRLKKLSLLSLEDLDSFTYFSSPLVLLIYEAAKIGRIPNNPLEIGKRLIYDFEQSDISEALETLVRLDLISDHEGILLANKKGLKYRFANLIDEASLRYQRAIFDILKDRVEFTRRDISRYSSYFFNIKKEDIVPAIKTLYDFNQDFLHRFESEDSGDFTYQLSHQFLPLSGPLS